MNVHSDGDDDGWLSVNVRPPVIASFLLLLRRFFSWLVGRLRSGTSSVLLLVAVVVDGPLVSVACHLGNTIRSRSAAWQITLLLALEKQSRRKVIPCQLVCSFDWTRRR
jgi:hypothetical protein